MLLRLVRSTHREQKGAQRMSGADIPDRVHEDNEPHCSKLVHGWDSIKKLNFNSFLGLV